MTAKTEWHTIGKVSGDYYARQSAMSDPGHHRALFAELQNDVGSLARIIHGLGIYDVVAKDFYDFDLSDERRREIYIRSMEKRLDRIMALEDCPLSVARPPDKRIAGRCNSYALALVSMLRAKGVPARSRCGFGAYLNRRRLEDHWVCEYWDADRWRWALADAQLDAVWCQKIRVSFDTCDVPREQFLTAADAWRRYRRGAADPQMFGISFAGLYGEWFMAASVIRDLAALNKVETLPWDVWGAMPRPGATLDGSRATISTDLLRSIRSRRQSRRTPPTL